METCRRESGISSWRGVKTNPQGLPSEHAGNNKEKVVFRALNTP